MELLIGLPLPAGQVARMSSPFQCRLPMHRGSVCSLCAQRKLEQAAECYEQALKMKLEVLGTGHRCAAGPFCS